MKCIAVAVDDAWVPHFATLLASIADNSPSLKVFLMCDQVQKSNQNKLLHYAQCLGVELNIIDIEIFVTGLPERGRLSCTIWARAFLPYIIPDIFDRILYLDADIIVLQGLDPLLSLELGGQ